MTSTPKTDELLQSGSDQSFENRFRDAAALCRELELELAKANQELNSIMRLTESLQDSPNSLLSHLTEFANLRRQSE